VPQALSEAEDWLDARVAALLVVFGTRLKEIATPLFNIQLRALQTARNHRIWLDKMYWPAGA